MFYPPELLSWTTCVSRHLPLLSKTQAQVLAWYSFAVTVPAWSTPPAPNASGW